MIIKNANQKSHFITENGFQPISQKHLLFISKFSGTLQQFNPFLAKAPILYSLKTPGNQRYFESSWNSIDLFRLIMERSKISKQREARYLKNERPSTEIYMKSISNSPFNSQLNILVSPQIKAQWQCQT